MSRSKKYTLPAELHALQDMPGKQCSNLPGCVPAAVQAHTTQAAAGPARAADAADQLQHAKLAGQGTTRSPVPSHEQHALQRC